MPVQPRSVASHVSGQPLEDCGLTDLDGCLDGACALSASPATASATLGSQDTSQQTRSPSVVLCGSRKRRLPTPSPSPSASAHWSAMEEPSLRAASDAESTFSTFGFMDPGFNPTSQDMKVIMGEREPEPMHRQTQTDDIQRKTLKLCISVTGADVTACSASKPAECRQIEARSAVLQHDFAASAEATSGQCVLGFGMGSESNPKDHVGLRSDRLSQPISNSIPLTVSSGAKHCFIRIKYSVDHAGN